MKTRNLIVAPSILACDFGRIHEETTRAEKAGADWIHLDIMDGHFVDNISFGPALAKAVRLATTLPLDVHLMIDRPDHYYTRFVDLAQTITVHVESSHQAAKTVAAIRGAGIRAGLAISPATPVSAIEQYLESIHLLLVMTVHPGFGGQAFLPETLEKVKQCADLRAQRDLEFDIEVDGGINAETAKEAIAAGANVLVAGTSLFKAEDMQKAISELRM